METIGPPPDPEKSLFRFKQIGRKILGLMEKLVTVDTEQTETPSFRRHVEEITADSEPNN